MYAKVYVLTTVIEYSPETQTISAMENSQKYIPTYIDVSCIQWTALVQGMIHFVVCI